MKDSIFDLELFNIYSDSENYYFFRALNSSDNNDLENGIITDSNGKIIKIRTDRERYEGIPNYNFDDEISLEQIVNHVKMHQDKSTNCISLTSNANTAITYGRGNYKDKYIMVKVPKSEMGIHVYQAGPYMLNEINKRIDDMYNTGQLDDMQKYFIDAINHSRTSQQLDMIKQMLPKEYVADGIQYEGGLELKFTDSGNFNSLTDKQNFEKNKIIMKLDVLNQQLLRTVSNKLLIQTIGNAFSSLELIHYQQIPQEKIIYLSMELIDVLGVIQQVPNSFEYINDLKQELIEKVNLVSINKTFHYSNYFIDSEISLDEMYELTNGKVDYKTAYSMYQKSFYLCKSKLRNDYAISLLEKIIEDNSKYDEILKYMKMHTYGIEPEITTRVSRDLINLSESVSLNFKSQEGLFSYITKLSSNDCVKVLENPKAALKDILDQFIFENEYILQLTKEEWYANSLIDLLNFKRLGVDENLSVYQRNDIIKVLIENDFYQKYLFLNQKGYKNSDIADLLFTSLIRNTDNVNIHDLFTLEELEGFIGYNRIKDTQLELRQYQRVTVDNINKLFHDRNFAAAILPTGAGKSFVALAEMYQYKDKKILYLAPNVEILNQIKTYVKYVYHPEEHLADRLERIVARKFPNAVFDTYQHLAKESAEEIMHTQYDLIIFDEIHRTGASEWNKYVEKLIDNQNENVKVLGITATPERDVDYRNMTNYWATKLGYMEEEIDKQKHLAINMDIIEAIKAGYIVHPKVVCCEYSLISDGTYDELKLSLDKIKEKNIDNELIFRYEKSRRAVEKANGIEQILNDNLKKDGKYIVFLPVTKKDNGDYEDEDGNTLGIKQANDIIKDYQTLMKQYFYSSEYFSKNGVVLEKIYNKINKDITLTEEELLFLEKEKENILLLSNINIESKPNALITKNSVISEKIINKMNWSSLSNSKLASQLNYFMRDKINDYSMLASYSSSKNQANLAGFNNDTSNKKKLMFVMNKLNEGVHVSDIDGIIWLRPLDENSRILYLQQLGRCIYSISEKEQVDEDKRPLVIDLVNNTLKVDLNKDIDDVEQHLMTISFLENWINQNGRYPNINSLNDREITFARQLNSIHKTYNKYLSNNELLLSLDTARKNKIQKILEIGSNIDLWSKEILKIEKNNDSNSNKNSNLIGFLEIKSVTKDFLDLKNEINEIIDSIDVLKWVKELINYCNDEALGDDRWPKSKNNYIAASGEKTSSQLASWLANSGYYNENGFKYNDIHYNGKPIKEIIDELYKKYSKPFRGSEDAIIEWVKELINYCEKTEEWPKQHDTTKVGEKTSNQLARWLKDTSRYDQGEFKYNNIHYNGKSIKEIIDELYNKYGKPKRGSEDAIIEWIKELINYCSDETLGDNRWPMGRNNYIAVDVTKTSAQLDSWLIKSDYYKGEFKYNNIHYNGKSIKEIIDELYNKYGKPKRGSDEAIIEWIKELINYCEENKKWPTYGSQDEVNYQAKTSRQLAKWLEISGYSIGNFKYDYIHYNDKPIKDIMDELHEKYSKPLRGSDDAVIDWVRELTNYCEKTHEWPKQHNTTQVGLKKSDQLARWLKTSGYILGEFKYHNIHYNDKPIKEIIDELYNQYGNEKYLESNNQFSEISQFIEENNNIANIDNSIKKL